MQPRVSIVAALGKNRELGKDKQLLWHISEDLRRFKQLTLGHPVILGRKTFDSILATLGKPLPERQNIVITRDPMWSRKEVLVARSIEEALGKAKALHTDEVFIIGGAEVWRQSLPYADRLYLTLIEDEKEADVYFPEYEHLFTKKLSEEVKISPEGVTYRWIALEKRS
jgi:dihydrofolate reductase